jgi:hypothetical protein
MQLILGYVVGLILGFVVIATFSVAIAAYKYRLYKAYINLYQITDHDEKTGLLRKYGFSNYCFCKPTLKDYFNAGLEKNAIVLQHWLRLVPVHGEKLKPISYKTIHEKKDSFNNVFKSVHNRNKKQKDIREPYTNA